MKRMAALLGLMLVGCGPDFRPAARLLADEPSSLREPVVERRRTYFARDTTRPRRDWHVLLLPGGTELVHGKESSWFADGQLEYEHEFDHGEPSGSWRAWYRNGQARSEATFGSSELAPMRWWHENGQLSSEGSARNGIKDGLWTAWHPSGNKASQGTYVNGKLEGPWTFWNDDGSLRESGEYHADAKVGEWIYSTPR